MRLVEEVAEESTNSLLYSPSGSDSRAIRKVRARDVCLDAAGMLWYRIRSVAYLYVKVPKKKKPKKNNKLFILV
jgi:hypothetical protein